MPGPAPKDPALRQRRNRTASAATLVVTEAQFTDPEAPPELPTCVNPEGEVLDWHPMTRSWWASVWASPMAAEYLDADVHGLFMLAAMVNDFWTRPTSGLAAEIRLQRQCFGLTPIDRRRLQWEVARAEDATKRRNPAPAIGSKPRLVGDPRSALL